MHKLTTDALARLLNAETGGVAVTIYIPTHRQSSPPTMNEDQIRFKNAVSRAHQLLQAEAANQFYAKDFLEHCQALMDDLHFWQHLSDSLLLCASPKTFQYFHLPADSDEYISVNSHFHLTPALGLASNLQDFYVLSVAQQQPRLYKGDIYELATAELTLPESLEKALNIDELYQKSLQFSTTRSPKGAMYHGHGGGKDSTDDERLRFWRLIDGMVCYDIDTKLPLVLAGTASEIAEFRAITKHPHVMSGHIEGNQKSATLNDLHEKSLGIIRDEVISKQQAEALERFSALQGQSPERTASYLEDMQSAAETGNIDTLLVGVQDDTAEDFEPAPASVFQKLIFPNDTDAETLDNLARRVFSQRGSIITLPRRKMPDHKPALAITRY